MQIWKRANPLLFKLALLAAAAQVAHAAAFEYRLDFNLFGSQLNFTCPGPGQGGVCAAVASINSFIYLENRYPNIYNGDLVPNYDPLDNNSPIDSQNFAVDGWQVGTNRARDGYYERSTQPGFDAEQDFLATKQDWFHDFAPGTTVFAYYDTPTIDDLALEISHGEDVEFFVDDGNGFYHAMTLTGVGCDAAGDCWIYYQDPNDPDTEYQADVTLNGNGFLEFTGVPGSGFGGTVEITAAFAESPVPEPGTVLLFATGIIGLTGRRFWIRMRAHRRS